MVNKINEVEMTDMTSLGSCSLFDFLMMRKQTTINLVAYNNADLFSLEVRSLILVSRLYFFGVCREKFISFCLFSL